MSIINATVNNCSSVVAGNFSDATSAGATHTEHFIIIIIIIIIINITAITITTSFRAPKL